MTPSLAYLHVYSPKWRGIRLWLPLFLLWIPFLLVLPLILLGLLMVSVAGQMNPLRVASALWAVLCGLRGTDVRVVSEGNHVTVRIL